MTHKPIIPEELREILRLQWAHSNFQGISNHESPFGPDKLREHTGIDLVRFEQEHQSMVMQARLKAQERLLRGLWILLGIETGLLALGIYLAN
jgi:hypothetical protein